MARRSNRMMPEEKLFFGRCHKPFTSFLLSMLLIRRKPLPATRLPQPTRLLIAFVLSFLRCQIKGQSFDLFVSVRDHPPIKQNKALSSALLCWQRRRLRTGLLIGSIVIRDRKMIVTDFTHTTTCENHGRVKTVTESPSKVKLVQNNPRRKGLKRGKCYFIQCICISTKDLDQRRKLTY